MSTSVNIHLDEADAVTRFDFETNPSRDAWASVHYGDVSVWVTRCDIAKAREIAAAIVHAADWIEQQPQPGASVVASDVVGR